jgi:hypothetical protein
VRGPWATDCPEELISSRGAHQLWKEGAECYAITSVEFHGRDLMSISAEQQALDKLVEDIVQRHPRLFSDKADPRRPADIPPMRIDTEGPPVSVTPGRMDPERRRALEEKVRELEDRGLLSPTASPWGARPLMVWEERKKKYRLCVDYRALNKVTSPVAPALPHLDDTWARLAGCDTFSSLDLSEAFWQILLAPEHQEKTAFYACDTKFKWHVVPYGLKNAPAVCQNMMNQVCHEVEKRLQEMGVHGVSICWLDDVILGTTGVESHLQALEVFFTVAEERGLRLRREKCQLAQTEVTWVGFVVSPAGRRVAMSRAPLVEWPTPKTVKQLERITGWCNWAAQDHPHLSSLLRPFYDAMQEPHIPNLDWAMSDLRAAPLQEDEYLAFPRPGEPMEIHVDASRKRVGASVFQGGRAVAHATHSWRECESKYPVRDLEMNGCIWALKKFLWAKGSPLTIFVDHESLSDEPEVGPTASFYSIQRWSRWIEFLLSYDATFYYKSGALMAGPDFLSRLPVKEADCVECACSAAARLIAAAWGGLRTGGFERGEVGEKLV